MDIIYIDRLFALNLILDYLLALCSARLCGIRLRRARYLLCALFGAGYSVLCVLPETAVMSSAPIKLAAGIIMSVIAYGGEERLLRCCLTFFGASALFGGAVWAVSQHGKYGAVVTVSPQVLVISFAGIYALLSLVFSRSVKNAERAVSEAEISFLGETAFLRCLHDSGNSLFDPVSGSRVLVASAEALESLFYDCIDELRSPDPTRLLAVVRLEGRMRLIPFSAVGTQGGLMCVFRPDGLTLDGKARDDIVVGISPTPLSGEGFDSLI